MLDSFGRPALASHLQTLARELNRRGLSLLRDGEQHNLPWLRSLFATTSAVGACLQACQPLMSTEHQQALKPSLRRQHQLTRPLRALEGGVLATPHLVVRGLAAHTCSPAEERCLTRLMGRLQGDAPVTLSPRQRGGLAALFQARSSWLSAPARAAPEDEAAIRAAIVGIYRRARKALWRDAAAGAARRRLASLAWIEELLADPCSLMFQDPFPDSVAGRLWMGLEEDCCLRSLAARGADLGLGRKDVERVMRLVRRRRKALAQANEVLMNRVVEDTTRAFAARLPWIIFSRLAVMPDRLGDAVPTCGPAGQRLISSSCAD